MKKKVYFSFLIFLLLIFFVIRREKVLLIILFTLPIVTLFLDKFKIKYSSFFKLYFSFWLYYMFISVINIFLSFSYYKLNSLIFLIFNFIIILAIFINIPKESFSLKKYFIIFRNFGCILTIFGICEFIIKKSIFYNIAKVDAINWQLAAFGTNNFRIFTLFLHPIVYGSFLTVLFWIKYNYPIKNYYLNKFFTILILINIYATQSRSCWIALVITLVINLLFSNKISFRNFCKKKNNINIYIILFIGIILIFIFREFLINAFIQVINRFNIVFDPNINDGSRTQRVGAIKNILAFVDEKPIGMFIGFGSGYARTFMENNPVNLGFNIVDNQYFTLLLETGFIGVILFLSPIFILLKNIKKIMDDKINRTSALSIFSLYITLFFFEGLGWQTILYLVTFFILIIDIKRENLEEVK